MCLIVLLVSLLGCELALVEPDHGHDFARRCVEEARPVAGDLVAVGGGEREADLVDALQIDWKRRKQEVLCARRRAVGGGEGLLHTREGLVCIPVPMHTTRRSPAQRGSGCCT